MELHFKSIGKGFPGVQALSDVSFSARSGSVHALCGENGAGKSTLLKILSGVYFPDSGGMFLDETRLQFKKPHDAIESGVAVIYQELHLVPEVSVAENIFLGHLPADKGVVNKRLLNQKAKAILERIGVDIDPRLKVGSLSLAQRQMVEIGKALSRNAKVIAFDEPTSSLSSREVEKLFEIIAELKRQDHVVFYVSHRMDEILRICDACTVLRDGQHVETFADLNGITAGTIVQRMVGRDINDIWAYRPRAIGDPMLRVQELRGKGIHGSQSIDVKSGEIVGIFGLVGAGRTELLKAIYRAEKGARGQIEIGGVPQSYRNPKQAIKAGLMLCPEDRKREGIIPARSVMENTNLSARRDHSLGGILINEGWERQNAKQQVDRLAIKTPSLRQQIVFLSGGNQQKVILGRWLSENIKVLMLDEPTRGIDVGAKREIYEILYTLAESGVAVLFVSSELPEVLGVADRILVMRQGAIVAEFAKSDATEESVLAMALPVSEGAAA
ncbi:MAG: L-arabinose ABC transporter ATP-binding protein AraG [Fimbriimonadaceae bacterium]